MSRRMISPQMLIKSQIVDDKYEVDLNEILEKYGTVMDGGVQTITLQIYNKFASDETQNSLDNDVETIGSVVVNGSITITKNSGNDVHIQGVLLNNNGVLIPYLMIDRDDYEHGIRLSCLDRFDLYVIRV